MLAVRVRAALRVEHFGWRSSARCRQFHRRFCLKRLLFRWASVKVLVVGGVPLVTIW